MGVRAEDIHILTQLYGHAVTAEQKFAVQVGQVAVQIMLVQTMEITMVELVRGIHTKVQLV